MKSELITKMYKSCSAEITARTNEIYQLLLGEGNFNAEVMILSDYPSVQEEEEAINFTQEERSALLPVLEAMGLRWEDVYLTHFVKYRPFKFNRQSKIVGREASAQEVEFFRPYLEKEISLIAPKLILTVGEKAATWLMNDKSFALDCSKDQLYIVGVLGKSYRFYPIHDCSTTLFEDSLQRIQESDGTRLRDILSVKSASDTIIQEEKAERISGQEVLGESKEENREKPKERVYESITTSKGIGASTKKTYVTVVYGGEGYVDDPTQVALDRISNVLTELGVGIHRINLHKEDYSLKNAFDCLAVSKGVVLGICVEWIGIGHRMQKFLDECFFHGTESLVMNKPLLGVCLTRSSYEREAYHHMLTSWELLGGIEGVSITALLHNAMELETNFDYLYGIDKKTEAYYRIVNQDRGFLPQSMRTEKLIIEMPVAKEVQPIMNRIVHRDDKSYGKIDHIDKLPVENRGLIEDYDGFIEKQQQDIQSISSLLKKKLSGKEAQKQKLLPQILKETYVGNSDIDAKIQILFDDAIQENMVIELHHKNIKAFFGQMNQVNVTISGKKAVFMKIIEGKLTMQRAFMTGEVKAKGDFTVIYKFDELFHFDISKEK